MNASPTVLSLLPTRTAVEPSVTESPAGGPVLFARSAPGKRAASEYVSDELLKFPVSQATLLTKGTLQGYASNEYHLSQAWEGALYAVLAASGAAGVALALF